MSCNKKIADPTAIFYFETLPHNPDPIEFDKMVHHLAFRSVLAPIVSTHKIGSIEGILAESWTSNEAKTTWIFKIRPNLKFENGDTITADDITRSWKRVAHLMKQKKSLSGFFEFIKGYEDFQKTDDNFQGLRTQDNSVIVELIKPLPDLLDIVSFGLYSIVHKNDYDLSTGLWKNPFKVTSSYTYKVKKFNKEEFELESRQDVNIGHEKKIKHIIFSTNKIKYDFTVSTSLDDIPSGFKYHGTTKSSIAYINCLVASSNRSVFHKRNNRLIFQQLLYKHLATLDFNVTKSFFPLEIKGVSELKTTDTLTIDTSQFIGKKITTYIPQNITSRKNIFSKYTTAFQNVCKELHADCLISNNLEKINHGGHGPIDLILKSTSILLDNPDHDIRFMFLSKEGIKLPDNTGEISKILNTSDTVDYQKINEELGYQSIVWPLTHFSIGLLSKDTIDASMFNHGNPPVDFSWIGFK